MSPSYIYWIGVLLPVLIFVVFLIFYSRKHLTEPGQRIWMAGFVVVLLAIAVGAVALQRVVSTNATLAGEGVLFLVLSGAVLWKRRHAGALLLALETVAPWYWRPRVWYSLAVLVGALGLLNYLTKHNPSWLGFGVGYCIYALVTAQGGGRLEVREGGLVLSPYAHTAWSRIMGYTLSDTTLTVRIRSQFGPSWPVRAELRYSPAERQALIQALDRYIPAVAQAGSG